MIHIDDRDGVRVLRMAHGKVSAMDVALCEALSQTIAAARADAVRAVVITGTGSAFSAGVDLFQIVNGGAAYVERFLPAFTAMLRDALTFPAPVVAAVNGHAIAGGCILAAACDQRVMAEGAGRAGIPELLVGVPFPVLCLEIMAARVPASTLRSLVYSGRTVTADHMVAAGLADETCAPDQLLGRACDLATQMASIPAVAFSTAKETFWRPVLDRVRGLADVDERAAHEWARPETFDAIRAYLDATIGRK